MNIDMETLAVLLVFVAIAAYLGGIVWVIVVAAKKTSALKPVLTVFSGFILFILAVIILAVIISQPDSVRDDATSISSETRAAPSIPAPLPTTTLIPTSTPIQTAIPAPLPTITLIPTSTLIQTAIPAPLPTATLIPTLTPMPTATPAPAPLPTAAPVAASSWNDLHDRLRLAGTVLEVCASGGLFAGCGTGWVFEDGWVITAAHVLEDAPSARVVVQISSPSGGQCDGSSCERGSLNWYKSYDAQYMGSDKYRDIAAVKLFDTGGLHPAPLPRRDIDSLGADEKLVIIGQSGGLPAETKVGVLSELRTIARAEEVDGEIAVIELAINTVAGDSGGAYVDKYGHLVGIVQGRMPGVRNPGRSLGLPLSEIEKVWDRLKAGEQLNDDLKYWIHYEFEQ